MFYKMCSLCGQIKPINNFRRDNNSGDGLQKHCKECGVKYADKLKDNINIVAEFKRCTKCGQIKSVDEFWRKSASKDGVATQCKICSRQYQNEYVRKKKLSAIVADKEITCSDPIEEIKNRGLLQKVKTIFKS